jgi:saccharopine dehydrogenase-like NADP-dependent oxidoreductase
MKVLLIGVGGVGEAIAAIARPRVWVEQIVLADYSLNRAEEVQAKLGDKTRFPVEFVDAGDQGSIEALARKYGVDLIMNAVDPVFNEAVFDAAFNAGATYMDMAMTLSRPDPEKPFERAGIKLGDYQFDRSAAWEAPAGARRNGGGTGDGRRVRPLCTGLPFRRD